MKLGKLVLGAFLAWALVAGLDTITNLIILAGSWQAVAQKGIIPTAVISTANGFWYLMILLLAVIIMSLFYAYGGKVLGLVSGKFWLGFGIGTLVNMRLLTQFVFTNLSFDIVILGLISNWIGFVAAAYIIGFIHGPGEWEKA